ncbi:MAG: SPOR domain-containing protein [Candidatus Omnitrophica bacterium]|nr:SPOR domain-containing protein [Candidatus Omnitrophota bacterium]
MAPNQFKNSWLIILLISAGVVIFFLSSKQSRPPEERGVVLRDIFHQQTLKIKSGPSVPLPKKADPVPPMGIVTSPEGGQEAGFAIQVYSFQDRNRAQAALLSLKNSGYRAFMVVSDLGEKGVWYRVRIGGIPDEASAKKMLADIRRNYNSGFILKTKD